MPLTAKYPQLMLYSSHASAHDSVLDEVGLRTCHLIPRDRNLDGNTTPDAAPPIFFRKRCFSGGDVCGVAPVPPPVGDRGGALADTLFTLRNRSCGSLMVHLTGDRALD